MRQRQPRLPGCRYALAAAAAVLAACNSGGGISLDDPSTTPEGGIAFDFAIRADILQVRGPETFLASNVVQAKSVGPVTSHPLRDAVTIQLPLANGVYNAVTVEGLGARPSFAALGDFDGDGRTDVALACATENFAPGAANRETPLTLGAQTPVRNFVAFAMQVAPGTFELSDERVALPSSPTCLESLPTHSADDLLVALDDEHTALRLTRADHWVEHSRIACDGRPIDLVAADVNADGTYDIVISEQGLDAATPDAVVAHLLESGTRSRTVLASNLALPGLHRVEDVDGDSIADLVIYERAGGRVLLFSTRSPLLASDEIQLESPVHDAIATDLDGDGLAEWVVADRNAARIGVAPMGSNSWSQVRWVELQARPLALLDRPQALNAGQVEGGLLWAHAHGVGRLSLIRP